LFRSFLKLSYSFKINVVDILDTPSYSVTVEESIMTAYYDHIAYEHKLDEGGQQTIPIGKLVI